MTYIVGLTGGIGCGKSTIEKYFKDLGAGIIDTDVITRDLQQPGQAGFVYIRQAFGESIVNFDGTLNRDKLRTIVFNDKAAKEKLETIMSPLIYHKTLSQIDFFKGLVNVNPSWPEYLILTVPLLVENKIFSKLVNRILVVDCPEDIQVERVMKRSSISKREVEKIIAAQSPRYFRAMKADDIIHNYDCSLDDNIGIVKGFHNLYCNLAKEVKTD